MKSGVFRLSILVALLAFGFAVAVPGQSPIASAEFGIPAAGNAPTIAAMRQFSVGNFSACVLRTDGHPVCWGYNNNNSFGTGWVPGGALGDSSSEMGGALRRTLATSSTGSFYPQTGAVFSGGDQTCLIDTSMKLRCTGTSSGGSLGRSDGSTTTGAGYNSNINDLAIVDLGTGRTALDLAPGGDSSTGGGNPFNCALLDNGSVKCWGNNGSGQLGLGDTNNRGDQAGEMGNSLPAVDLGTGVIATALSAGQNFACAIVEGGAVVAGSVKCWGGNDRGQLGQGNTANLGNEAGEMGDALPVVNIGTGFTAKALALGQLHACVIRNDDSVVCWGANFFGELGANRATFSYVGDAANEMGSNLVAVNLGAGRTARLLSAGNGHTCALLDDDSVKCWGNNGAGQLGLGDTTSRGNSTNTMATVVAVDLGLNAGEVVRVLDSGNSFNCVFTSESRVKCWGDNGQGQLGIGQATSVKIGDAAGEMGSNVASVDFAATSPTEVTNLASTGTATSVTFSWDPPAFSNGTITAYEATCGSRSSFGSTWNGTNTGWTSLGMQQSVTVTSTNFGPVASEGLIECQIRARTVAGSTGEGMVMRIGRTAGLPLTVTASSHTVNPGDPVPTITGTPSVNGITRSGESCSTTYTVSSAVGTYPTLCSGGSANGYAVTYSPGVVTVVLPAPTVSAVTPTSGPIAGGTAISISGTGFANNATVTVNGVSCVSVVVVSATAITCSTPAGTAGPASLIVTSNGQTNAANTLFTYDNPVVFIPVPPSVTQPPASVAPETPSAPTAPSLINPENQQILTQIPGGATAIVNGQPVEVDVEAPADLPAARIDPEDRSPQQVQQLQRAANEIVNRLAAVAGGSPSVSVEPTPTGAVINGLLETKVPVEDVVLVETPQTATVFAALNGDGSVTNVRPGGVIQIEGDGTVGVLAYGLKPSEVVEFVIMSTPQLLGKYTVNDKGEVKANASLPDALGAGNHTLVVASPSVKASLGLQVNIRPLTLPVTGADSTDLGPVLILISLGVILAFVSRRRIRLVP